LRPAFADQRAQFAIGQRRFQRGAHEGVAGGLAARVARAYRRK
jgi:hypothetical protein